MKIDKPKLLIAGGGYAEIPLIQAGKSLGFHVITTGNRVTDLGHQWADEVHHTDFSDRNAMLTLAKKLGIDAICAGCNDFSALTAAFIAEKLKLPGHDHLEVAEIIHHKDQYRNYAQRSGVLTPNAKGYDSVTSALSELNTFNYPLIIKPVDLTGGKGIATAKNINEAKPAIDNAFRMSRAKRIVIEDYIEGSRHGISTFLRDGKICFYFHDDEHYYKNPFLVSAASSPGDLSPRTIITLVETIEKIALELNLVNGIVHVQFIVNQLGDPIIIEICRRAPGDLYMQLVKHATGINYSEFVIRAAAGMNCSHLIQPESQKFITRHCIMSSSNGQVQKVTIDRTVQNNIFDKMVWWKFGDLIENFLVHKCGIVFLEFNSASEMREVTPKLQELIHVEVLK